MSPGDSGVVGHSWCMCCCVSHPVSLHQDDRDLRFFERFSTTSNMGPDESRFMSAINDTAEYPSVFNRSDSAQVTGGTTPVRWREYSSSIYHNKFNFIITSFIFSFPGLAAAF